MKPIGKVSDLYIFPVKSMAGISLDKAWLTKLGLKGDRFAGFKIIGAEAIGYTKQYLTARKAPELLLFQPVIEHNGDTFKIRVHSDRLGVSQRSPSDPEITEFFKEKYEVGLELRYQDALHDQHGVSLMGNPTLVRIERILQERVDPLRFRSNILIEWWEDPLFEDSLVGRMLQIGDALLHVEKQIPRCVMVNYDPCTIKKNDEVLKAVGSYNKGNLGIYASCLRQGMICREDEIFVE